LKGPDRRCRQSFLCTAESSTTKTTSFSVFDDDNSIDEDIDEDDGEEEEDEDDEFSTGIVADICRVGGGMTLLRILIFRDAPLHEAAPEEDDVTDVMEAEKEEEEKEDKVAVLATECAIVCWFKSMRQSRSDTDFTKGASLGRFFESRPPSSASCADLHASIESTASRLTAMSRTWVQKASSPTSPTNPADDVAVVSDKPLLMTG